MRLLPFSVLNSALCSLSGRRWRASLERQIAPYFYSFFFFFYPFTLFFFFFLIKSITVWEIQISSFLRKLNFFLPFFSSPLFLSILIQPSNIRHGNPMLSPIAFLLLHQPGSLGTTALLLIRLQTEPVRQKNEAKTRPASVRTVQPAAQASGTSPQSSAGCSRPCATPSDSEGFRQHRNVN